MKPRLTIERLRDCAGTFAAEQGGRRVKSLHGVTDGKAVGTHIEHEFQEYLEARFTFRKSTSAAGIDFPDLLVDIKTTSIRQPQSSCPFKSARQKIYGLGYSLLVFAYEKKDDARRKAGVLTIRHVVFVAAEQTADFQTTNGILALLDKGANRDDLVAFMHDRLLPVDEIAADELANEILSKFPVQGFLTISNALQWRLQYSRVIELAGTVQGVLRVQ